MVLLLELIYMEGCNSTCEKPAKNNKWFREVQGKGPARISRRILPLAHQHGLCSSTEKFRNARCVAVERSTHDLPMAGRSIDKECPDSIG
jgi:hypothetical protein